MLTTPKSKSSPTMMRMMRFLTAFVAVINLSPCFSFQLIAPQPLSSTVQATAASVPRPSLKLPPRGGGAPSRAMMASVNGDSKATFNLEGSLAKASAITVATVVTYALHNQLTTMGPVQASGIVAIASTLLLPEKLALSALCGSFAGMAKAAVVPTLYSAGLLGMVCAGVMSLFDKRAWLIGFGGRLGFIAQCACTLQFLFFKYGQKMWKASEVMERTFGSTAPAAMLADVGLYEMSLSQIRAQVPPIALFTVAGAIFMRLWKRGTQKLPNKLSNSVAAVGVTGLLGGLYLPSSLAGPAFCGSFVAMASPAIIPSLLSLVLASVLAGLSQLGLTGMMLGGWGGKLGTAAFMGVLAYRLMIKAANKVEAAFQDEDAVKTASNPSEA